MDYSAFKKSFCWLFEMLLLMIYSLVTTWLKYNSYTIQVIHLKYIIQLFLQSSTTITTINFTIFSSLQTLNQP